MKYTNEDMTAVIDNYVHSERDRMILKRRLIDGIFFEPLAEEFDLSTKQVQNIVHKYEPELFKHLS